MMIWLEGKHLFRVPRQNCREQSDIGADVDCDFVVAEELACRYHFLLARPQHSVAHKPVGAHDFRRDHSPNRLSELRHDRKLRISLHLETHPRPAKRCDRALVLTAWSKIFYHVWA